MSSLYNIFRRTASKYMRNILFPRKNRCNHSISINIKETKPKTVFKSSGNAMVKSNGGLRGGATKRRKIG